MNGSTAPKSRSLWLKLALLILLVAAIAAIEIFLQPVLTSPATYRMPVRYLDEKLDNAKMISLGTTSASFLVSLIPDDAGTPIAGELAKFSGYLLLVISAIFLERYLLTTIGFISGSVFLPLALFFMYLAYIASPGTRTRYKEYAVRCLVFGVCIILIIPAGCLFGQQIEKANEDSIQAALADARSTNAMVKSIPDDSRNFLERLGDFFSSLWNSASEAYDWAKTVLNNFMSSIAVMLVTTIAIPILMLLCFLWLIRFLTRRDFVVAIVGFADRFGESARRRLLSSGTRVRQKHDE